MKQSDVFSIILVASIGTFGAFFVCQALMGNPDNAKVEFVGLGDVITSRLEEPDSEIFKSTAINPTVEVYVGSCEDLDHNGILDEAEIEECDRREEEEEEGGSEDEGSEPGEVTPEPGGA